MSDSKKQEIGKEIKKEEMADPKSAGRNANDDFNEEPVDDYGVDMSQPGADEELQKRADIKSGVGPAAGERNSNDNFDEEA